MTGERSKRASTTKRRSSVAVPQPPVEPSDSLLDALGSLPAGQRSVERFCASVELDDPIDPALLKWLSAAFRVHLERGVDLGEALSLRRPRGRPPPSYDDLIERGWLAARFCELFAGEASYEEVRAQVAGESGLSERTVEAYYADYQDLGRALLANRPARK